MRFGFLLLFKGSGGQNGCVVAQALFERESLAREGRLGHSYSADSGWGEGGKAKELLQIGVAHSVRLYLYMHTRSS